MCESESGFTLSSRTERQGTVREREREVAKPPAQHSRLHRIADLWPPNSPYCDYRESRILTYL